MKESVLVAWGICRDGQKVLLHMGLGNKESYTAWQDFIRDMLGRGLPTPVQVTTDGAPGLIRQYFPKDKDLSNINREEIESVEQRLNNRPRKCLGFKTPNVGDPAREVFFGT